jgi:hypothetical protein
MKDLTRRQRAAASYERRKKRLAKKPIETLVQDGDLFVTYNPNSGDVTIRNGVQGLVLIEAEAIMLRDALLERLA